MGASAILSLLPIALLLSALSSLDFLLFFFEPSHFRSRLLPCLQWLVLMGVKRISISFRQRQVGKTPVAPRLNTPSPFIVYDSV